VFLFVFVIFLIVDEKNIANFGFNIYIYIYICIYIYMIEYVFFGKKIFVLRFNRYKT